ncbi:hypothetical protein ACS0TY_006777 [Phlomoides rotata]
MGGARARARRRLKPLILAGGITHFMIIIVLANANASESFNPSDNYLINCGSPDDTTLDDGRTFKSDPQSSSYLSTDEDILTSITSFLPPLYLTARIFHHDSMYRFLINKPGRHWIRLYFYPLPHPTYNLTSSTFTVTTNDLVLLHAFSLQQTTKMAFKEYLINITSDNLTLKFSPTKNSAAFINAIEVVSAPNDLIPDSASTLSPAAGDYNTLNHHAMEVSYRLNVGGHLITPMNDTLSRTWLPDTKFMTFPQGSRNVSVPTDMIQYPKGGATPLIAPPSVYSTADRMADSEISDPNFNLTWLLSVDPSFSYLIRLHFCDIISTGLNELYFNIYINGITGASNLDLSTLTSGLAIPYYKDFVLNATSISNGSIIVQVGPTSNLQTSIPNAILNGVEVMKMSNSAGSLDGLFSSDGSWRSRPRVVMKIVAGVGLALGAIAFLVMLTSTLRWYTRPRGYEKQKTFSSWLLPLNSSHCSFLSSKSKSSSTTSFSNNSGLHLGRFFTLNELCQATKNFDENSVVGVGGFGKVYVGEIVGGTKVAIKRGNPSSSQGMNEFQTEIELLSKLRHRHLVSLIGYCDEQAEMILVYEYMGNGPLRDHLYGSSLPPLSWRQRLEICIGAARGLHYLHTGSTQGIIHRDVKTTNILLDENFEAKVSDFGLSKTGPSSLDQTHVSTAVKGSFGYLDPEYFRRQQLTEKSDVYSFGVVLFEVLCARPALDPSLVREQVNLAEWAKQQNGKGWIKKIVDGVIVDEINQESLVKFVDAADKCLAESGVDRPSMGDVLWNLEYALQLLGTDDHKAKIVEEEMSQDSGVLLVASPTMFIQNFQGR